MIRHENKIPIILSNFVVNPDNYSSTIEFKNPGLFTNKSRPIYLNCIAEFYIRPPIRQGILSFPSVFKYLTLPRHLRLDFFASSIYNYYFAIYKAYHFKYKIMLTTEKDTNLWEHWIGQIAHQQSFIDSDDAVEDFLIGTILDNQNNEHKIEKVFIVCEFCNLCNRTYLPISLTTLNNLVEESKNIGRQFSKVHIKWSLWHANLNEGTIVSIRGLRPW